MKNYEGGFMGEKEQSLEARIVEVGALKDFGLGNPDGIPSRYAGASAEQISALDAELLGSRKAVTETDYLACIDGRKCLDNYDGSSAEIRRQIVGGTACNLEMALIADAPFMADVDMNQDIIAVATSADAALENATGYKQSGHEGGCGGAKGTIDDCKETAENPKITEVAGALLSIPEIAETTGVAEFSPEDKEFVRSQAARAQEFLTDRGWNAEGYARQLEENAAHGLENLEVGDDKFHGHAEDAITIVVGEDTLKQGFVIHAEAVVDLAKAYSAGQPSADNESYRRALLTVMSKHVATGSRLASQETPVKVVVL